MSTELGRAADGPGHEAEDTLHALGYEQELKRSMSLADVVIYGLIYMVPLAPVAVFGIVYNFSSGAVVLVYVVAAIAMFFSAVSYKEMATEFPIAGSVYSYVRNGIGDFVGFISGWAILLDYLLLPALLCVFAASAMTSLVDGIPGEAWVVFFVVATVIINVRGIDVTAKMNRIFLYIQMVTLAAFIAWSIVAIAQGQGSFSFTPIFNPDEFSWNVVFGAIPIAALSYIGFDAISTLNEEAVDGGRTTSRATMIVLWAVTAMFIVQVYFAAAFVPKGTEFADGDAVNNAFYNITGDVMTHWFKVVVTLVAAMIALFANTIASNGVSARLLYSMARDGQLPKFLSKVTSRQVPANAMLFIAALSILVGIFGVEHVALLTSLVTFGALTAYILLHLSVLRHFIVRTKSRKYFVHLVSPVIGSAVLVYALWNASNNAKTVGLIWLAIGCVFALGLKMKGRALAQSDL
ncbi:amino acid transporter [Aeromicrobium sp. Root344]|uniref:APC family permease n=1 Tax=Aeromicrobium sp. Root344 TaxID=1736521 RepID=UPI0006FB4B2B|nr:APC family permease [Aeromicrobium sp. Root344]KQV74366.1 amino acid transporter [Aeromicrobium sp. Root344]